MVGQNISSFRGMQFVSHLLFHPSVCIASLSVFIYNCYLAHAKWLDLRAELQADWGQAILKLSWYLSMSVSLPEHWELESLLGQLLRTGWVQ